MKISVIVLLAGLLVAGYSQEWQHNFTFHAAFAFPQGDFADANEKIGGYADMGFGGGVEYTLYVGDFDLGWVSSLNYITNEYGNNMFTRGPDLAIMHTSAYESWAFTTGVKLKKDLSDNFIPFFTAQAGFTHVQPPYFDGRYVDEEENVYGSTFTFNAENGLAYQFGLGAVINRNFTISMRYVNLDDHSFQGDITYIEEVEDLPRKAVWDQSVAVFYLTLGYTL